QYFPDEEKHTAVYVYSKAVGKVARLYGPSLLLGAASIGMLTGSHVQLTRRNSALMAAYSAVQTAFAEYRQRVESQMGKDAELDIFHDASYVQADEDDPKSLVKVANPSGYSIWFDEG